MRSLKLAILCVCGVISLAGCPTDPVCGDYVCESAEREGGAFDCPLDCKDDGPGPGGYCDSPASQTGAELDMWLMQQWCSQWCWSAVITNVANFYGRSADGYGPVQECQLASYRLGDPSLSVCCQYAACDYQACNSPGSFGQMNQIMTALGLYGQLLARPLNETEIQIELTNGRPVIMAIQSQSSGHVALLTGYSRQSGQALYRVDDPWPYNMWGVPSSGNAGTRYFMSYSQLVYGSTTGQSLWVATYTRLSPRADGCSPPVNPSCACGDGPDPQTDCGDGVCQTGEDVSCPGDCPVATCPDPSYPVDCMDGTGCWTPGTNCDSNVFTCNGSRRCADISDYAACCNGTFITCPSGYPHYCPNDNLCYASPNPNCSTATCSFTAGDC